MVIAAITGCGRLETYGEKISNRNVTAIKNIVMHPQDYEGKAVTVEGRIALVCETGCWFNLEDEGAAIYTDLAPSGFAIPQNVGRKAIAEGRISIESGKLILTARGVEIR
ncbi:MAG: DNA-binding protein [Candidatus Omnitrophota bacterium]